MKQITETLSTPVRDSCDVAVCGGGIAGISAALAAARRGADVLLIEREYATGGLATLGLVTYYLPICDGMGRQVVYGIGEELLRLSIKHGCEGKRPDAWLDGGSVEEKAAYRFKSGYNGPLFILEAEKLLKENGVRILYGTQVCSAVTEDKRITALVVENKSGRYAIEVQKTVIDATGDADVAAFAGAETALYPRGNTLSGWYYYINSEERKCLMFGGAEITEEQLAAGKKQPKLLSERRFTGIDGAEISEMVQMSHTAILEDWQKKHSADPTYLPDTLATIPQLRMTRRICGYASPDIADDAVRVEDSIGLISSWRKRGPVYELPLGCIIARGCRNLLAAGRDISVTDRMWDITRVIPSCAVTGEAAGAVAALFDDFSSPDTAMVHKIQDSLRTGGVRLHTDEL